MNAIKKNLCRTVSSVCAVVLAAGLMAGCGTGTPAASSEAASTAASEASTSTEAAGGDADYTNITMKFSTSSAEGTLTVQAFKKWGELLTESSGGKVNVDVFASSVLGNNTEATQGAQLGTIDMVVIQPGGIADMGASKMNLLSLPYLFGSYDQYCDTLFGDVGDSLLKDVDENAQGLIGFSFLPDGGRCYFTKDKPITCLEDIKGMKLRVQSYEIDGATANAIGFSSTPTAFSELYSALQTGVVEGAENPLSGIDGNAFYEVCHHLTLDNHTYNTPVLLMSEITWNKLTPATQQMMKDKWVEMVDSFYKPQLADYEAGLLKKFEEKGMTIHEVTDYDKWVEAVAPVWEKYGADLQSEIAAVEALK